ncbi:MAG: PilZ domain-containing protein [gamma proteobacterium symbiont of Bathyaustriella thionipta]|nr:PilZ domain-containing protein [gamma proteobacterium symbiont of Bathyaustriella thionipta]MCU7953573.1 PilZ domain-containing protein [gamma proteobacterium symbiont of Bathyaustriella thionipta]
MFIHWNQPLGFYIDTIIKTNRNTHFFDYIGRQGQTDFSAFCLPKRIEKFSELARDNQSAVMFTYWENNQFYSVFDFEFQSPNDMAHVMFKVKTCKGRIYKALTNLNKKPAAEKITAMLSKIQKIDAMASKIIDKRACESIAQVIFTDVTKVFCRQNIFSKVLEFNSGHALSLTVISNNEKVRMADGHIVDSYDKSLLHQPDIVDFNIDHHRYDPRYQYEMTVSIKYKNHIFSAQSIDFSRSGLGLVIKENADIPKDSLIEITFSSLLIKGITTQLKDITHRVMISRRKKEGLFLGVIRNTNKCDNSVNRFFQIW